MTLSLIKRIGLGLVLILIISQAFRPARTNPSADPATSVTATATVPPEVSTVLKRSCFDCHSNETRWPWYSVITPMGWLVADHVNHGRSHMNFSVWGNYPVKKRVELLEKMCDEVREGEMPLKSYLLLHPGARLIEADWKVICDWSGEEADRLAVR